MRQTPAVVCAPRRARPRGAPRRAERGFTLLEVMVAVTILGLGLTMILSSQAGLFASTQRVQHETIVGNLLRCKMSEIELKLMIMGLPLTDQAEEGTCCEEEDDHLYHCEWKVETVLLPQPSMVSENQADPSQAAQDSNSVLSELGGGMGVSSLSNLQMPGMGDTAGGIDGVASSFSSAMPGGPVGIASMAMSLVYPTLKPMLEASIRRVTVRVVWKEGNRERDFSVVQFVTDPRSGALNPNLADFIPGAEGATGAGTGATGTPGSSSTGSGTSPSPSTGSAR